MKRGHSYANVVWLLCNVPLTLETEVGVVTKDMLHELSAVYSGHRVWTGFRPLS